MTYARHMNFESIRKTYITVLRSISVAAILATVIAVTYHQFYAYMPNMNR